MKNVLYIGNALSSKGKTTTSVESLGAKLGELHTLKIASNKSNKILRLLDMIKVVIYNRSWADYILIDTYSTTNFYYALIVSQLARWFNIKYIPILHGGNLENRLKNSKKISDVIFNNAYRLVSPSNFLKNVFEDYGFNNVLYIPNAIELENFEFQNRDIKTIKLLWLRSFSEIYNPKLAVLVLEELISRGYQAELTMVGPEIDGSMEASRILSETKNLNVNFTGKLDRKQWTNLAKDCNVFINTTNFDNMPVSVIEAMALGLPVVSTNVGGLPYLIAHKKEGLLVPPNDAYAMSEAVIKLMKDKNLKENIVNNARKKVEQYNWEVIKPKWIRLLS
ncbi:glycosyltransferase family 4 protein [Winogradskyella ouciana]|uniref:Glycosyltransferase n=1 Tax=Winogradskyella ouciana TaxID=2608631 RepID=A0A7K1GED4_9FLAO|nr:glycosyltransferase family 4 protein [Winogradskyella ouciana]MTE27405.1 glycosyltransferase [Winogradskyella ouciana]